MIIAGDIGGTNSRLVAATCHPAGHKLALEKIYPSQAYARFEDCLREFMHELGDDTITAACFALAGPVNNQTVKLTNLPWELNAAELAHTCKIPRVQLLNDFAAVGYGIPLLTDADLHILQSGSITKTGLACVLGAGTGLGQATIELIETGVKVWPGEGGHCDFAPRTDIEFALASYWNKKLSRVSNETFLSGRGIQRIFEFLVQESSKAVSLSLQQAMTTADPAAAISQFAIEHKDVLAVKTIELFSAIYGSVAGNLALMLKPTSGVYLAGGIAPKIIDFLKGESFIGGFNAKTPMHGLLENYAVKVVMNDKVGLLGAIHIACQLSNETSHHQ